MAAEPASPLSGTPAEPSKSSKLRMYCVVRSDLGDVPTGKLMVQAGHAFVHSLLSAPLSVIAQYHADPEHGKIVLNGGTEDNLRHIESLCRELGFPHHLVTDFAHTVFKERTVTVLGIGPIDPVWCPAISINKLKRF